jgi:hypothetical protein
VLDVVFGGALGEVKDVSDLAVSQAVCDKDGDLSLAAGEAIWSLCLTAAEHPGQALRVCAQGSHAELCGGAGSLTG